MDLTPHIEAFKLRIQEEPDFCLELYNYATVRLLSHKYAYYILNNAYIDDITYDGEEKSWYVMGIALGLLKEDDTSPCIDFDYNHPLANDAIALANKLCRK